MTVVVRDAVPDDFPTIAELTVDVYVGEGFSSASYAAALGDMERRSALSRVIVAVNEEAERIVGAVSLVTDGELAQIAQAGEAEIRMLAVVADGRGRGVGEALVRRCLDGARAHGARRVVLSTQPSMEPAQRLYHRMGFTREPSRDWQAVDGRPMLVHAFHLDT